MAWQQLTLSIDATALPRTEALLRLAGAESVAISEDGDDAPILEPAPGTTPLWPRLRLRALFAAGLELEGIRTLIGDAAELRLEKIDEAELTRAARQVVEPVAIGPRLALVPAEDLPLAPANALGLHMGLAFGTGRHPTTRLCLEWLESTTVEAARVLDYGCGTGVLALAALKLGAARATAIDHEPQALAATRRNAALNALESCLETGPPESLPERHYDLVLANILAQPLIDLAPSFAAHQTPGGRIALSGILSAQFEAVVAAYEPCYGSFERREVEGWGLLIAHRRSEYDR